MAEDGTSVWTEERLDGLKKLWSEGLSITQIGMQLGVSRNAVVGKVHRMGLPKRQSPIVRPPESAPQVQPEPRRSTITFDQWDRTRCSWPIGDPKSASFRFCGEEVVAGRPYCSHHCAVAYTSGSKENAA